MKENDILERISWERVRMLTIDELQVTLLLHEEEKARVYDFPSSAKKEEALNIWFGKPTL